MSSLRDSCLPLPYRPSRPAVLALVHRLLTRSSLVFFSLFSQSVRNELGHGWECTSDLVACLTDGLCIVKSATNFPVLSACARRSFSGLSCVGYILFLQRGSLEMCIVSSDLAVRLPSLQLLTSYSLPLANDWSLADMMSVASMSRVSRYATALMAVFLSGSCRFQSWLARPNHDLAL